MNWLKWGNDRRRYIQMVPCISVKWPDTLMLMSCLLAQVFIIVTSGLNWVVLNQDVSVWPANSSQSSDHWGPLLEQQDVVHHHHHCVLNHYSITAVCCALVFCTVHCSLRVPAANNNPNVYLVQLITPHTICSLWKWTVQCFCVWSCCLVSVWEMYVTCFPRMRQNNTQQMSVCGTILWHSIVSGQTLHAGYNHVV